MDKKERKLNQQQLRDKAEEILDGIAKDNEVTFPKEIKRILHELQVYRVELEMQNDELTVTQLELEKSRNRYADLYDNAPVGYFTLNQSGEILMLNNTGARMLGYSRHELISRNFANYATKADKDLFFIFLRNVFHSTDTQTIELSFLNKKGIPIFVQLEAVVPESEDQQRLKQCRVALIDITERKITEAQLREREESLREAQEMANIGSWSIDLNSGKVKASAQLYTILGLRRSERIVGETLQSFVHPDDKLMIRQLYDKIKQDGQPFSVEYRIVLRDSRERWLYTSNKAETNSFARITRLTGFIQDITEQKQATELRIQAEKLETASNFARTITHEVRNPLTTVNLSLAMLRSEAQKTEGGRLENYISTIERNIKRVDQLITQLLYSSRPNESIFSRVNICSLLDEALEAASDRVSISGAQIVKNYHTNCILRIDAESVKIAVLSILINAVEATKVNKSKITVITEQRDNFCYITIRDNGTGIQPALLKKIFDPFYTTKTDGMGLGLSNTRTMIEASHGKIIVESEVGVGTSFIISFPV